MGIVPEIQHLVLKIDEIAGISSGGFAVTSRDIYLQHQWKLELERCQWLMRILDDAMPTRLDSWRSESIEFFESEYNLLLHKIELSSKIPSIGENALKLLDRYKTNLNEYCVPFLFKWSTIINDLAVKFKDYRHRSITAGEINRWLKQFSNDSERLLALNLLTNVDFIRTEEIGVSFKKYYQRLAKVYQDKIRVVLLGTQADSMAEMEKIFNDYCGIEGPPVVCSTLKIALESIDKRSRYIFLFVDDIVGTGTQSSDVLREYLGLYHELGYYKKDGLKYIHKKDRLGEDEVVKLKRQKVIYVCCCAQEDGYKNLPIFLKEKGFDYDMRPLTRKRPLKKCFDQAYVGRDGRPPFSDDLEREQTMRLCRDYGEALWKDRPLGYGNSQQLIVFTHNTPNNSLPILWKRGTVKGIQWKPLFPQARERE